MQPPGEELRVLGARALVLERQHGDRVVGELDVGRDRRIRPQLVLDQQECDGDGEYADDHVVDLAPGVGRDRLFFRDFGGAHDAVGCQFKSPREDEGQREAENEKRSKQRRRPVRQA